MNEPASRFKQHLFIATYVIVLSFILLNLKDVIDFISQMFRTLSPFIVGIAIAFVLNIPMKFFENKLFSFLDQTKISFLRGLKRPLSITATFLLVFGFLIGLILFIIPQLIESAATLVSAIPIYISSLEAMMNQYMNSSLMLSQLSSEVLTAWKDFIQIGSKVLGTSLASLLTITLSFTTSIVNFGLSLVLAVYILSSKEKLLLQIKKVIVAFFKKSTAQHLFHLGEISHMAFYHFVAGQFIEALIIGILCFIGMSFFGMPYPLLISVIIAVTSLIPVFGAFIGTIPTAFIIFIISPIKALWFIVFIIVLQQFESNVIYPKVVGSSIGLSGLWVMLAMLLGGSTFGIVGLLIGIPVFSILYQIIRSLVYLRLKRKKASKSTSSQNTFRHF